MIQGSSSSTTSKDVIRLRRTYQHVKEVDIVGLEEEANSLVEELLKEEDKHCVVSICGMGGIGKTTLAKIVYNCDDVINRFDVRAWTFISQQCRAKDVLQEILRQVCSFTREGMNEVEQVETLFETLTKVRCLVVLDDIWNVEDWDLLKYACPNGVKGSKVMLTTRNKKVANEADPWSRQFEPKILNEEQAWDLMCRKSFHTKLLVGKIILSGELEKCGRAMVKRCSGLPLAIVVLGGILTKKKSLIEWEAVSNLIGFYMSQGQTGVHAILGLSIIDLPLHLKPLFLFLGHFPEDYKISVNALIKMWIAEGFVSEIQGNQVTMESIGRHYFNDLIQRCVVQIAETNWKGDVKTCQMHDMMRDVCIAKARQENFLEIIQTGTSVSSSSSSSTKLRRCTIYVDNESYVFPPQATPCLRSAIFFQAPQCNRYSFHMEYKDFKLLKVLELKGIFIPNSVKFGELIGKLVNLRYLGLCNTGLSILPESIGCLVNLQTLDLRGYVNKFPDVMRKLEELRHFHWEELSCTRSGRLRMNVLRNLPTLLVICEA